MLDRPDASLGIRRVMGGVVLVDRSCGTCAGCLAAAPLWCLRPEAEGRDLTPPFASELVLSLSAALAGAASLVEAPAVSTVLVVDEEHGPLAVLVRALVPARVLVSPNPYDAQTKSALAETEPSGRARVVVAGRDARAAVKVVRRGGHVCVGDSGACMASITELVQREVTLVGPRDIASVVRRAGESAWAAAVSAAA